MTGVQTCALPILYLLDDMGVKAKGNDWAKVNETLLNPRIAGKLLYEMSLEELKECAKRLRAILNKRKVATEERQRLERLN